MGNDGGSIPTRRELVKEGAKDLSTTQVKEIQTERQEHFWSTCALSHQPLTDPVVSDGIGTLYNKEAVLSHLLADSQNATSTISEAADAQRKDTFKDRLRSLRDVVEVKFTPAPSEDIISPRNSSKWICPITNKVFGAGTRAIYLVPCGHAFAESLMSTISEEKCLQCDQTFEADNVIPILPTSREVKDRLTSRLADLSAKGLTHSLKKAPKDGSSKKRKKAGPTLESEAEVTPATATVKTNGDAGGGIQNKGTAALTEKVLKEQEDRNKRRKMAGNDNVQSLFSKGDNMQAKKVDFMTRGFSITAGTKR